MRTLLVLTLLAGCDLQPPAKKKQAPPPPAEPVAVPADAGPPPPPDAIEATPECTSVAVKIATALIDEAQDSAQKAALEQERSRIVRRTAEACTADAWPEAARNCFLAATTTAQMQICGKDLAAPRE